MIDEVLENKFKTYFDMFSQNKSPQSNNSESLLNIEDVQKQLKICKNKIFDLIKSGELKSLHSFALFFIKNCTIFGVFFKE